MTSKVAAEPRRVSRAALLGLLGSPLAAQVMHEEMTCSEFRQSTPEVQTEVVDSFLANAEETTEMTNEEIVSTILNACTDAPDDMAHAKFRDALDG